VTNSFTIYPLKKSIQIGTTTQDPKVYGFDFYGIKQDEKIYNTDIRKVGVVVKQAYTTQKLLPNVNAYYRVYVREGQTKVQVQDWAKINKTPGRKSFPKIIKFGNEKVPILIISKNFMVRCFCF
jgi:hypothetical protein